jgi:hypothetical protein
LKLQPTHPLVQIEKSIHQKTITPITNHEDIFKSGSANKKLGGCIDYIGEDKKLNKKIKDALILKGKWSGMPMVSLTIEERSTCPTSCLHWLDCYGNSMGFAKRYIHGEDLEKQIKKDIRKLARIYKGGFVVRLHILGDFYSLEYVKMWGELLDTYKNLYVFGYTARLKDSPIGDAVYKLQSDRWWIRISNGDDDEMCANEMNDESLAQLKNHTAFICPHMLYKKESTHTRTYKPRKAMNCSRCGACWSTRKTVIFPLH